MGSFLKWSAIAASGIILVIIIGIVALPFIFPLEKIKQFAVAKLSETIHRQVTIDKVSFDIFSGIKLQGLAISERKGFGPREFVKADAIELHYAFWPLFSRQIIVQEASLIKPEIVIEKNLSGQFNFSDLLRSSPSNPSPKPVKNPTTQPPDQPTAKPPFDLFITSFSIKKGRLTYIDKAARSTSEIKDLNLSVTGFELALIKPIDFRASASIIYQGKNIPVSLNARIGMDLVSESVRIDPLSFSLAGEDASARINLSGWRREPKINFFLSSKKLSVDPLLAVLAVPVPANAKKPEAKPGELTRTVNRATAAVPRDITVNGTFDLGNILFQGFKVDKAVLAISLAQKKVAADIKEIKMYDGTLSGKARVDLAASGLGYDIQNLKLDGFNSTPFVNALAETVLSKLPDHKDLIDKVYGILSASITLKGQGVEPDDILKNAVGNGAFSLKGGELKRLKTLTEVGKTLHSNTLQQDLHFGNLAADFNFKNRVVMTSGLNLDSKTLKLNFKGGVDLGKFVWVGGNRLTLKLSPAVVNELPKELAIMKDESGWLELTFEMTGALNKPFPKPIFEKPIEKVIGKIKVKIEAKKIEIEQAVSSKEAELKQAAEAARASAEAEAKAKAEAESQRLQEEAKQKAKKLLGF